MPLKKVDSTADFRQDEMDGQKVYNVSRSRLMGLINIAEVARIYLPIVWYIVVVKLLYEVVKCATRMALTCR